MSFIVMLSLFLPTDSFAEMRIVDSRYVELTGHDYLMWKQGALSADGLCTPVGYLTMKAPPYLEVQHCFCGDPNRFAEQPNPADPEQAPQSVLFLAYGDQDGDPIVCPWEAITDPIIVDPDGSESEPDPGPGRVAGEVPPEEYEALGGCSSVSVNACQTTTGAQCALKNTNNDPGSPWQWCGASPHADACKSENGLNVCK